MDTTRTLSLALLILLHPVLLLRPPAAAAAAFVPKDNFLINCGGDATVTSDDGRAFHPDDSGDDSSLALSPISRNVVVTNSSDLHGSARVFTRKSEYKFGIARTGRHFLRLHFRPLCASRCDLKSAVFSVAADGFTLFRNFSYPKSRAGSSVLLKEFIVETGSSSNPLTVVFAPSDGSVAFINAIEVISMPDGIIPSVASPVPPGTGVKISTDAVFETIYRINVGGPSLDPRNDSLWRVWETDRQFLINPASARNVSTNPASIRYPAGVPVEAAPNSVYTTAQEMADANVGNQKFNISWLFEVDSHFSYLVRLHFCDFLNEAVHSMLFNVYINNQSALSLFDITSKTELSTAYFVDFVVNALMESDKIMVQVGPSQVTNVPPNAILNGVEILKFIGSENTLDASGSARSIGVEATKKKRMVILVIPSCLGGATLLGLIIAVLLLYLGHRKKAKKPAVARLPSPVALHTHTGNSETKVSARSYASSRPSQGLGQLLAFSEIQQVTKNFDESLVIGVGGFGKVYKGVLDNGIVVAVKRGNPRSQQGLAEFRTEIEMLSKLRHRHLVSLIGYCHEANEMVLVYEYMAGGPLRKHLYGSDLPALSWKQRLEICIGAAKGLHYLHTGAAETIIHRDVKTTNILLDENLTAKVADFGLSKSGPTLEQTHVSTAVKGSFGYLDPEYFRRQRLTEKSDLYSFGVVLMEVLCARPAVNPALPRDQVNIVEWATNWQRRGQLEQLIDPHLVGTVSLDSLRKFGETAEKCLAEHGAERPSMGDVLWNLEYALQLQESFTTVIGEGSNTNGIQDLPKWIPQIETIEHDNFSVVSDGTDGVTSRVFSQLMDPRGR
ncbi:receptor-like protein kinase THESEUS 1 [Phoenix dactylifera]|uniref:Receptor-like protein kinase THESEUS 1 n=1 Tax=Phoenix dactylifera TaxID=42345 RepID=A0A8B9A0L6_PHODC|nr:receptor-like protein kinase THESEUS 1 [Phoenix dactylifera]XP_038980134.1 receptor-like protein kinase THESEUS 1 [Phoenix dactylifera]XP_038980135.1 receptor-like protein kinase THESEUS 1 [Phoenix dactylifera]